MQNIKIKEERVTKHKKVKRPGRTRTINRGGEKLNNVVDMPDKLRVSVHLYLYNPDGGAAS